MNFGPSDEINHAKKLLYTTVFGQRMPGVDDKAKTEFGGEIQRYFKTSDIVGFGAAPRYVNHAPQSEYALTIYVEKKRLRRQLENPLPRELYLPHLGIRVPIDVIALGNLRLQTGASAGTSQTGIVGGGSKIRHEKSNKNNWGSLGCVLYDPVSQKRFILSNLHVIAPMKNKPRQGDNILDHNGNTIAKLTTWVKDTYVGNMRSDAAIAEIINDSAVTGEIGGGIGLPTGTSSFLFPGREVVAYGARHQRIRESQVVDPDAVLYVKYQTPTGTITRTYENQVICRDFTDSGDSGSLVMSKEGRALGLHFYGSIDENMSVFNRFTNVIADLESDPAINHKLSLESHDQEITLQGDAGLQGTASAPSLLLPTMITDTQKIFAQTLWGEAEGEGVKGMEAVAEVIVNRTRRNRYHWPNTIKGVCLQNKQFSCWNGWQSDHPARRYTQIQQKTDIDNPSDKFATALEIAKSFISEFENDPDTNGANPTNHTRYADHYYARTIAKPNWATNQTETAKIGQHLFYNITG